MVSVGPPLFWSPGGVKQWVLADDVARSRERAGGCGLKQAVGRVDVAGIIDRAVAADQCAHGGDGPRRLNDPSPEPLPFWMFEAIVLLKRLTVPPLT